MIGGLFSIVVSSVIDAVVGRTANGVLDGVLEARATCPRCGVSRVRVLLANPSTNHVYCRECRLGTDQYTNWTAHTRRPNGSLLLARLSSPLWDEWGGARGVHFTPFSHVEIVEGRGESLIAELALGRFGGSPFHTARIPVRTRCERENQPIAWSVPPTVFPTDIDLFTVDVRILNLYGDQLDTRRDIGRVEFES